MPLIAYAPVQQRRKLPDRIPSSLRLEVAKWFDEESFARVTRFGRIYPGGSRYVCISARKHSGFFALYFFHHGANDWRIYPPVGVGPSIVYWSVGVMRPSAKAAPG